MSALALSSSLVKCCLTLLVISLHFNSVICFVNTTVDNLDERIIYHGKWKVKDNGQAINDSVSETTASDSYFTFQFEGTAVYVVANCATGSPPFSPAIDGDVPAQLVTGGCASKTIMPVWGASGLLSGVNHTLNVTIKLGLDVTSKFALDALLFTAEDVTNDNRDSAPVVSSFITSPIPPITSHVSSSITERASTSFIIVTKSASSSSSIKEPSFSSSTIPTSPHTAIPVSSNASIDGLPTIAIAPTVPLVSNGLSRDVRTDSGATIGGAVGGGIFALLLITTAFFWIRRVRHQKARDQYRGSTPDPLISPDQESQVALSNAVDLTTARSNASSTNDVDVVSCRLLQEMSELRMEIALLKHDSVVDYHTGSAPPPGYDDLGARLL